MQAFIIYKLDKINIISLYKLLKDKDSNKSKYIAMQLKELKI